MYLKKLIQNKVILLVIISVVGVVIRFYFHWNRDFFDDEIGTLIWIKKDTSFLLSHFKTWLTMNYFIFLGKAVLFLSNGDLRSLIVFVLCFGVLIIPATYCVSRTFLDKNVSVITALLVMMNPYLIKYSGVIRSYSILTFLSLLAILYFLRLRQKPNNRDAVIASIVSYFLVLMHPNGIYIIVSIGLILLYDFVRHKFSWTILANHYKFTFYLLISMFLVYASYIKIIPGMLSFGKIWHNEPPIPIDFLYNVFEIYFSKGFYGWLSLFFLGFGIYKSIYKHDKIKLLLVFIITPIFLISIQGLDVYPWAYARFLIFILPLLIIYIVYGMEQASEILFKNKFVFTRVALTILIIMSWLPAFNTSWNDNDISLNNMKGMEWKIISDKISEHNYGRQILYLANNRNTKRQLSQYMPGAIKQISDIELKKDIDSTFYDIFFIYYSSQSTHPVHFYKSDKIKVLRYNNVTLLMGLKKLKEDLVSLCGDSKISPILVDYYKNIVLIDNKLGYDKNTLKYLELYLSSLMLTRKHQVMPIKIKEDFLNRTSLFIK